MGTNYTALAKRTTLTSDTRRELQSRHAALFAAWQVTNNADTRHALAQEMEAINRALYGIAK